MFTAFQAMTYMHFGWHLGVLLSRGQEEAQLILQQVHDLQHLQVVFSMDIGLMEEPPALDALNLLHPLFHRLQQVQEGFELELLTAHLLNLLLDALGDLALLFPALGTEADVSQDVPHLLRSL